MNRARRRLVVPSGRRASAAPPEAPGRERGRGELAAAAAELAAAEAAEARMPRLKTADL